MCLSQKKIKMRVASSIYQPSRAMMNLASLTSGKSMTGKLMKSISARYKMALKNAPLS